MYWWKINMRNLLYKNILQVFVVVLIGLCLVVLNPKRLFSPVREFFFDVARPFQKTFYFLSANIHGFFDFIGSISELKKENEQLTNENNTLSGEVASLREQEGENKALREQLGLIPKEKFHLEASFVIGQNPQKLGSWLLVDKGSSSGIETGMPVIASEGILVGKVEEAYSQSSRVVLLSDSGSAINAVDLETGTKGIVKGEYALGIIMDMISQSDIVNVGDMIVTSGLGSDIPQGLLIGKVKEVRTSKDELFQQALIIPRIKYSGLETVFMIKR